MSWTLKSTGDLVGDNGENLLLYSRGSPSLPFIHENEVARIHRKRCWRTKAVKSLMRLGELKEKYK